MKVLHVAQIEEAVCELCIRANTHLPPDVCEALQKAEQKEAAPFGRYI